jgi:hypothetical protein
LQVGGYASVAYSRFGTVATTHSGAITTTNDVLINGDLEVDGSAYFDGTVNFSTIASASLFHAQPGTATSPSFTFAIDKDTGMFRRAINALGFSTLGVERLTIDSSGNVGIGSTNPGAKLDVVYPGATSTYASKILHSGNGSSPGTALAVSNGYTAAAGNYEVFGVYGNSFGSNYLTVRDNGNVGIGTTAPNNKLQVYGGSIAASSNGDNNDVIRMRMDSANNSYGVLESFWDNNTGLPANIAVNPNGGNVGIGTTGPGYKLEVNGTGRFSNTLSVVTPGTNNGYTLFDGTVNSLWFSSTNIASFGTYSNHGVHFLTNNDIKMVILAGGNVGIGTTSPNAPLSIRGASGAVGNYNVAYFDTATGDNLNFGIVDGSYSFINANRPGVGTRSLSLNPSGGNVGIGTTGPGAKLQIIAASGTLLSVGSGNNFNFSRNLSTGALEIQGTQTGFNNIILASASGNVGIGTTVPETKLEIVGTASASAFYATGDVSALTFTDRTPGFEGDALFELSKIKSIDGKIDHKSLPDFMKSIIQIPIYESVRVEDEKGSVSYENKFVGYRTEEGRNLGNTVTLLVKAVQEQQKQIDALEKRVALLDGKGPLAGNITPSIEVSFWVRLFNWIKELFK